MNVRTVDNVWIPLTDGTRLAARLWLPVDAEAHPVPAILEYLPYRKDDGTALQDRTRHPYFASRGYAAVRVDLRGTGDSDGVLCDEYLAQEQDDALEVISWIARQSWCTGKVGMIGYSWGGFNGLQVAARRPPALGAVVTAYSTDDRYADDCHYMGGCVLGSDMLKWASSMRAYNALPPDPRFRDDWRDAWLDRLERTPPFIEAWLTHQTRDGFWKHGSVRESYGSIAAPTLVVGGWADAYTNAVPRLLRHLTCERRGIIGPWGHVLPHGGIPGPAIDFLAECVRWFDRWLKGLPTGVEDDPCVRVWMQDSVAPARFYDARPGRWIALDRWPEPDGEARVARFGTANRLIWGDQPSEDEPSRVTVSAPEHTGTTAGVWCANGYPDELPDDQRDDDERSACFDTAPLPDGFEVLGAPVVRLRLSSDVPQASVIVRLCEVAPDGASTLVSWGMLNLSHRAGHERPQPLEPGAFTDAGVALNVIGHRFSAGNVVRVAVSQAYWPHAWPSPSPATLILETSRCELTLPLLPDVASESSLPFGIAPQGRVRLRDGVREREVDQTVSGSSTIRDTQAFDVMLESNTRYAGKSEDVYEIAPADPLSAIVRCAREESLTRDGWTVRISVRAEMRATATHFIVDDALEAFDGDEQVFAISQRFEIARQGV